MAFTGLSAVINVGSAFIRMVIAEYGKDQELRVVETAVKFLSLGRDVFTTGQIRKKTMSQAIIIFHQCKELLASYGILPIQVKVIGTSALREAQNRDNFVDRIEIRTGFRIQVIDGIEENRLSYMAVQYALKDQLSTINKSNSIIIEVGGGSTEMILLRRGLICAVHSLSFGTIRIQESYRTSQELNVGPATIRQSLSQTIELLDDELKLSSIKHFIAIGNYARLAGEIFAPVTPNPYFVISRDEWKAFSHALVEMTPEECVKAYGVPLAAVEGFGSALLAYSTILDDTGAEEILVPKPGLAEGLLMEQGPGVDPEIESRFLAQVRSSAFNLGKKFHFDAEHARHVAELSLNLFDGLSEEHNLGGRHRLLLEIAALLHDIGTYVKPSGHHKHGQYLVENSEIFGLEPRDVMIVGNVVRYHRKTGPLATHPSYAALDREDRLVVLKLSSLLRVADALDRGHTQRIRSIRVEKDSEEIRIRGDYTGDVSAERFSLTEKAQMFEDVFGLKVSLL